MNQQPEQQLRGLAEGLVPHVFGTIIRDGDAISEVRAHLLSECDAVLGSTVRVTVEFSRPSIDGSQVFRIVGVLVEGGFDYVLSTVGHGC